MCTNHRAQYLARRRANYHARTQRRKEFNMSNAGEETTSTTAQGWLNSKTLAYKNITIRLTQAQVSRILYFTSFQNRPFL